MKLFKTFQNSSNEEFDRVQTQTSEVCTLNE